MFRSWNDDNSPNCEMKSAPGKVEWMKAGQRQVDVELNIEMETLE